MANSTSEHKQAGQIRSRVAFALFARVLVFIAIGFLFYSASSPADDDVQQEAVNRAPRLHVVRICRTALPDVDSAALVSKSDAAFEPNADCRYTIPKPQLIALLAHAIRPPFDRSPPAAFPLQ